MDKPNAITDRRSHQRFTAGENVFAVIKRKKRIICKVANLSEGGFLFYSEDLDAIKVNSLNVDVYINDDVYIHDVPVKVVSDFTAQDERAFDGFPIRYLRLAYSQLTPTQKDRLIDIINNSMPSPDPRS